MHKFFIIGCPRSGTTLLQQILGRHPDVLVPPETAFFTKLLSRWPGRYRRQRRQIESDLGISLPVARRPRGHRQQARLYDRMAAAYAQRVGRPDVRWFGDKTPDHLRYARVIAEIFPAARFILIYRDGRDVALSLSKVPWAPPDPMVGFGMWLDAVRLHTELIADPPAPVIEVRYEELVRSPQTEVPKLTAHLDLDYRSELLEPQSRAEGVPAWERSWKGDAHRAIRADRIGVWRRELDARQVEHMERWGGDRLRQLGYEASTARSPRPGVLPAGAATHLNRALWRARVAARFLLGGN